MNRRELFAGVLLAPLVKLLPALAISDAHAVPAAMVASGMYINDPCDHCTRPATQWGRDTVQMPPRHGDTMEAYAVGPLVHGCDEHPPRTGTIQYDGSCFQGVTPVWIDDN